MIKQPIWGPGKEGGQPIGHITQVHRAVPSSIPGFFLCATLEPVRVAMEVETAKDSKSVVALGLLAHMYQGLDLPCRPKACCASSNFRIPFGVWCLDCGLGTETDYQDFKNMLDRKQNGK